MTSQTYTKSRLQNEVGLYTPPSLASFANALHTAGSLATASSGTHIAPSKSSVLKYGWKSFSSLFPSTCGLNPLN